MQADTETDVGRQVTLELGGGGSSLQPLVNVTTAVGAAEGGRGLDVVMGNVYFYLTIIASFLSIVGCCLLVLTFILFRELRNTGRKLVVCLSVADFLTAVGNFIGIMWYAERRTMHSTGSKILCQFHASLTIFSSISSFLWTASIAIHIFVCISLRNSQLADKLFRPFLTVCWTLPGIVLIDYCAKSPKYRAVLCDSLGLMVSILDWQFRCHRFKFTSWRNTIQMSVLFRYDNEDMSLRIQEYNTKGCTNHWVGHSWNDGSRYGIHYMKQDTEQLKKAQRRAIEMTRATRI